MTGSLADLPNYVADAFFRLPEKPFVPEDIVLGTYTYLPWARTGIAAALSGAPAGVRAAVTVHLPVQGGPIDRIASQALEVRGPGDVVSLNAREVIHRQPQPGATRVEDTFLVHVEFDRPDMLWVFTPSGPTGSRLVPWLVLVVVLQGRSDLAPAEGGLPARLTTKLSELQPLDDSWAWGHTQLVGPAVNDAVTATVADRLTPAYGDVNLSRLVCPRRLEPDCSYRACLVPAYQAGVLAGLGDTTTTPTLDPAWTRAADGSDADQQIVLPAFTSWTFSTGADGDFRSLAERLVGQKAPWQVGRRILDAATPGGDVPDLDAADPGRLQTVHAPVYSPQAPDPGSADPIEQAAAAAENARWPQPTTEHLRCVLNRPDQQAGRPDVPSSNELPPVGPEIYARYQAGVSRVDADRDADWLGALNLNPTDRVVAGLGARVVERDQEQLMQSAWAQVGSVDAVNIALRHAQLARFAMSSLHARTLSRLDDGRLLQTVRPVHARIISAPGTTVHAQVAGSAVADAALSSGFRRATSPRGRIARFVQGAAGSGLDRLIATDGVGRDHRRDYADPDGISGVSALAAHTFDPDLVAQILGLPSSDGAADALLDHGRRLAQTIAVPDMLTPEAVAKAAPVAGFSLSETVGAALLDVILRSAKAADPVATVPIIGLLRGLATVSQKLADRAGQVAADLERGLVVKQSLVKGQAVPTDQRLVGRLSELGQEPAAAAAALLPIGVDLVKPSWPGTPERPALSVDRNALLAALDPALTVTARIKGRLGRLPDWLPPDWFDDGNLSPIMAAPVFLRPMYQALADYDRDWLIPGLASMPQADLVTILVSNAEFATAFLVGLSHEMGRELLWRGYPTDQRGTYFRRFWNPAADELANDIHLFPRTDLASQVRNLDGRVVILVRGELIRRYPAAVVTAVYSDHRDAQQRPVFSAATSDPSAYAPILFHDQLSPDIVLVGFDLTVAAVRAGDENQGWWFVISEHPTAPRFGLAEPTDPSPGRPDRADLHWGDLPTVLGPAGHGFLTATSPVTITDPAVPGGTSTWGLDAATNAHLLLVDPVRAAFDARVLLEPTGGLA